MKKSEMVTKLTRLLKTYEDCKIDHRAAQEILNFLEKEGMSGPSYEGLMATGEKYDRSKHQGRDTACFDEWEPE